MASCCLFVALKTQARPTDSTRASRIPLKDYLKWVYHVRLDCLLSLPVAVVIVYFHCLWR